MPVLSATGASAPSKAPIALVWSGKGRAASASLVRVDSRLLPLPGRKLKLGPDLVAGASLSPDRSLLGLGTAKIAKDFHEVQASFRLVNTQKLSGAGSFSLGTGLPVAVGWADPGHVLVVLERLGESAPPPELLVVDPEARRIVTRRPLLASSDQLLEARPLAGGLLVVWSSSDGISPLNLGIVDAQGTMRQTTLERVVGGIELVPDLHGVMPGIAVAPDESRLYVVSPDLVAEVDVSSLAVAYHSLAVPLPPEVDTVQEAEALPNGMLAVAGTSANVRTRRIAPLGLRLIDPTTWTARTIDPRADSFAVAGKQLLATASLSLRTRGNGVGLSGYSLDGKRRFRLLRTHSVRVDQVYRGRAYVTWWVERNIPHGVEFGPSDVRVIDVAKGRLVGRRGKPEALPILLTTEQPQPAKVWRLSPGGRH